MRVKPLFKETHTQPFWCKKKYQTCLSSAISFRNIQLSSLPVWLQGGPINWLTENTLLAVTEARAASLSFVVILLDISAAFDTVNHQILLSTLQELGVSGSALPLFTSYLKDRTYSVI